MSKIKSATIVHREFNSSEVYITLENGEHDLAFRSFPDELMFSEEEFIGLTPKEAIELFVKRDKSYLQS